MVVQHNFYHKRLCSTKLIGFLDKISCRMDRDERVEVHFEDSQRAYDSVNHKFLDKNVWAFWVKATVNS